jgi:hypothetical protein
MPYFPILPPSNKLRFTHPAFFKVTRTTTEATAAVVAAAGTKMKKANKQTSILARFYI